MTASIQYKRVKKYVVMVVSEDGLLKHPKDNWSTHIFNTAGYDTEDEAVKAIEVNGEWRSYVILPIIHQQIA